MHTPDTFELYAGLFLVVPGVVAAVLFEEIPLRALLSPEIVPAALVGAIFGSSLFSAGVALVLVLYYVGVVAVVLAIAFRLHCWWTTH